MGENHSSEYLWVKGGNKTSLVRDVDPGHRSFETWPRTPSPFPWGDDVVTPQECCCPGRSWWRQHCGTTQRWYMGGCPVQRGVWNPRKSGLGAAQIPAFLSEDICGTADLRTHFYQLVTKRRKPRRGSKKKLRATCPK